MTLPSFLSSLVLGASVIGASLCLRDAVLTSKRLNSAISVRGLSEQEVKSDQAVWRINYVVSGEDLQTVYRSLANAQQTVVGFFGSLGLETAEVEVTHPAVVDNSLNTYGAGDRNPRFSARASVIITTNRVDAVREGVNKTSQLVEKGVVIEGSDLKYYFTKLNDIKPNMLRVASENAAQAAQALSRDTGVQLGDLVGVSQGLFTITSPISDDSFEAQQSLMKKVRVVTQATYTIK